MFETVRGAPSLTVRQSARWLLRKKKRGLILQGARER